MRQNKRVVFFLFFMLSGLAQLFGQDRIELGWQTTRRGIVWYQSGLPTHQPAYRLSRDTNAVLWVDTLTALRYDWDYKSDRWRTRGTSKSSLPPLPQQTSGSAVVDNTTALWVRDTFNLLHKYDSTANAWTPMGDFMYLSNVPTDIAATGSNGAAKYRQSLWQDADTYLVYYWDGSVWQQFGNATGGDNWGTQVAQVTARLTGDGTVGLPLDIAQQGATSGQALKWNGTSWAPANDADTDLQKVDTFAIVSNTLRLSIERDAEPFKSVDLTPYLDNTDNQVVDTFTIVSNVLRLSVESDGQPFKSVDLTPYLDDTDLQQIDTFRVNAGNVELSVQRDAQPVKTIPVTDIAPVQAIAAGTGMSVSGTSTVTITNTGDVSNTNELQTLNNTGDATSHTVALSNSGGSVKLKEGANIALTTDVNGLNGEVTISATASADGNGIYGDGTAGSGSDALPPGGSEVTIPGIYQPLKFLVDASPANAYTALQVNTDYTGDDAFTHYLLGKTPVDSFTISAFDNGTKLWAQSGKMDVYGDQDILINSQEKIIISADSIQATANTVTAMPWVTGEGASGYMKRIQGASSGQILKWNGSNWALAADETGGGGLTGAENGLSVSGSNVRLGGTLITSTLINQDANEVRFYGGKWSYRRHTIGHTPVQTFGVDGYEGDPTTGMGPTADGIAEFQASNVSGVSQSNSLTLGAMVTDAFGFWMQSRSNANQGFYYPLLLQPNGGRLAIGRNAATAAHFTIKATSLTGSTASGMVALLENTGGSGNVSLGFGAGSDAVSGQLMWNGTSDAMRITNRNSTNGTSSVRVAIGGETSDVATFEKSSAASLVQFGVGTTAPHSTIQSAGSFAAAYLETVGAPTFDETKHTVVYTASTNISWTLPTAAACACQGRVYILHHSGTAGTLTLSQFITKGNGGNFNTLSAGQWAYIVYGSSSIRGYKLASL